MSKLKFLSACMSLFFFLGSCSTGLTSREKDGAGVGIDFEVAEWLQDEVKSTVSIIDYDLQTFKKTGQLIPRETPTGSGVVLQHLRDKYLIVLTAKHVVDALSIEGRMYVRNAFGSLGDKAIPCHTLKVADEGLDLALVISDIQMDEAGASADIAKFAPSVGDKLIVIGSPNGHAFNISIGVLSSVFHDPDEGMSLYRTDASVYFGNSGGPAFNEYGDVVGIVVAMEGGMRGIVPGGGIVIPTKYLRLFVYGLD
jgi:S1-C subfamily serine protease